MKEKKKKAPSRRNDVIRCPKCGEDYSITYKRCPFCEERPGRLGVAGSGSSHPIQLLMTILSFAVIITALFIVFKYVSPMILGHQIPGASTSADTSQSGDVSGDTSGDSSLGDPSVPVNSLSLSRTDVTLAADERYHFTATVDPETALVTWTSSDDSILTVDEKGTITNVNTGDKKVKVTVTATAGDKSAECTVYCNGNSTKPADNNNTDGNTTTPDNNTSGGNTTTPDNNTSGGNTTTPDNNTSTGNTGTPTTINKRGFITNAENGLNIRSGPGKTYDSVASAENNAEIRVLEDSGTGWYKIDYGNGRTGYVSKDYVTIR